MKIAVLSLPLTDNYGGILQSWALQKVLIKLGHHPRHIRRHFYKPPLTMNLIFLRMGSLAKCMFLRYVLGKKNVFVKNPFVKDYDPYRYDQKFINSELLLSKIIYSSSELYDYLKNEQFDVVIVGSDQVWRQEYSPCITDYFLVRFKGPKIAYGASFGKEVNFISPLKIDECQNALKEFKAISCREYSGVKIVKELFGLQADKVLDPTLLLTEADYRSILKTDPKKSSATIVTYILDSTCEKEKIVEDIRSQKDFILIKMGLKGVGIIHCNVPEWIANIANSEYVVTDSFHGCVFSIIFRKPFVAIANRERGLDRFLSLLKDCGLESRLVFSHDDFVSKKSELLAGIDYDQVYRRLNKLREDSLKFLKDAIA